MALSPTLTSSQPSTFQEKFDRVVAFFKANGFGEPAARGIAAGMWAESKIDHTILNPTSGAYGLGQWMRARRLDFLTVMGKSVYGSSFDDQLKFMLWELNNSEKKAGAQIKAATTDAEALRLYVGTSGNKAAGISPFGFMRPAEGGEVQGDLQRGATALGWRPAAAATTTAPASSPPAVTASQAPSITFPSAAPASPAPAPAPAAILANPLDKLGTWARDNASAVGLGALGVLIIGVAAVIILQPVAVPMAKTALKAAL